MATFATIAFTSRDSVPTWSKNAQGKYQTKLFSPDAWVGGGSAPVESPLKVWNGTEWVAVPVGGS